MSTSIKSDATASPPLTPGKAGANLESQRKRKRNGWLSSVPWYVMVLPALALIVWLIAYPFIDSFLLSFQKVAVAQPTTWVGLDNFVRMFNDPEMWASLQTTLIFAVFAVLIELVLAWVLALLLWGAFQRVGSVVRVLFAIPMLLSPVVVGVVWRVLLNPQYGWIPAWLHDPTLALLSDVKTALPTMILIDAWQWTPFMFLIIAAGLNALPEDVLEAARIDGATSWRMFFSIVWPLTLPVTLVAVLFRGLDALKTFDLPYNLTAGGPGTSTQTIAIYLYRQAFTRYDQGYAAALSLLATVIMAVVAVLILVLLRRAERRIS